MNLLHRLWSIFSSSERRQIFVLLISILVVSGLDTLCVGIILPYIGLLNDPAILQNYPWAASVLTRFGFSAPRHIVLAAGVGVVALYIIKNGLSALLIFWQYRFLSRSQCQLSRRLLSAYLYGPWTFHLQRNTAELLRNINTEALNVFNGVLSPLLGLIQDVLVVAAILAVLAVIEPAATLSAVILLGGFGMVFSYVLRRKMKEWGKIQQRYAVQTIKWIQQSFGGVKEIKVLRRESFFIWAFARNLFEQRKADANLYIANSLPRLFLEVLFAGGILLISYVVFLQGQMTSSVLPKIGLFAAASFRLMPSIIRMIGAVGNLRYHLPALAVVHADLRELEKAGVAEANNDHQPARKLSFERSIELRELSYRYPNAAKDCLSNVSLHIPKGCSAAITGPSGAGKTTMVDVILGLLKPTAGKVLVDGRDIHENLSAWQQQIGYVPQTIYLTDDTIRRNVAFGLPDEEIDDDQVWTALRYAQLEEFVRLLPEDLDAKVGERGVCLSGGQRQRIGIARALYHDPDVLVLDEATSSLDTETEREFTGAIERLTGEKTLIIIAHRLSTVEKCDIQYRIRNGRMERHYTASNSHSAAIFH